MRWLAHPVGRTLLTLCFMLFVAAGIILIRYYNIYAAVIDLRLSAPIFSPTSLVFAAPKTIAVGETISPDLLSTWLRRAGYAASEPSPVGRYTLAGDTIEIRPGLEAYRSPLPVDVQFQNGQIAAIHNATDQSPLNSYQLEPEVITTLFETNRIKRRIVNYQHLPPTLINAVVDIEDRDFFNEGAVNWWRVPTAAFRDIRSGQREQGASTITMQVARGIFGLGYERHGWAGIKRKLEETLVATELVQRLTKQQIFELYANQLYLGQRGSYSIHGFGEAADAYFGEDIGQLTLPQCALLAGIIHGPNLDSPYRHPQRAIDRRDEVLQAMVRARSITPAQAASAQTAALHLAPANNEASDAPYFVDMVRDRIGDHISPRELSGQSYRIYTTLDPDLQVAAARAVALSMPAVDKELGALRAHERVPRTGARAARAQVALIAIDPHTGAVLALVGGRNYGRSQLNHVLAERPTGSIFKPFVYATALETGLLSNLTPLTETSIVDDVPTTFAGGYQPANFENKFYGEVTLRTALEHSLNNATISLAVQVGLPAVTDLAHAAGIVNAQPTPSEAIGTYTATPLTMAGAYTIFANGGVRLTPRLVDTVDDADGASVFTPNFQPKPVLDPRIAFLTTDLMESVLSSGTAVRVRADGFLAPAAGKTGTSHDAWFAGYTDNLLCVVWVGLDDYENLNIEGAHAALPIWTEFMKEAVQLPAYANPQPFAPPPGVVAERIDTVSQQLATPLCPPSQVETDYYLDGTEPKQSCHLHPSNLFPHGVIASALNLFGLGGSKAPPPPPPPRQPAAALAPAPVTLPTPTPAPAPPQPKKRGLFGRIFQAIGGGG
ncbi:MAG TPA: transglycosylase domain-containing protein [Terriglobales bacterium]